MLAEGVAASKSLLAVGGSADLGNLVARLAKDLGVGESEFADHGFNFGVVEG